MPITAYMAAGVNFAKSNGLYMAKTILPFLEVMVASGKGLL